MPSRYFVKILLVSCLVSLSIYGQARAHKIGDRWSAKVDALDARVRSLERTIPQLMREGDVPGLSIVIIRDAQIYWHRGFGLKNNEQRGRIEDSTIFEIASLTKPVLAYGALKLVDAGKLDLDTPLVKYLPGNYVEGDDRSAQITARMVLSHTTGLQNELHPGERLKIHFIPGERFSYSGEGFIYLQKVIEHITGDRFDAFMKKTVFEPLGMTSASYVWLNQYEDLMANGHNAAGIVAERNQPAEVRISWLHMSALDYSKFIIAVMNGNGLNESTAKLMRTPQVRVNERCIFCLSPGSGQVSPSLSWGIGWGIEHSEVGDAIWHWGENRGEFQTFAMAYPKEKIGLVVFTNSGNGLSILPDIVSKVIGGTHPAFAWMGYERYNSPKKIQFRANNLPIKILFKDILLHGQTAINQYRRVHNRAGSGKLNENQLNTLGYWLKGKNRLKEAIEIFKINTDQFPNSSNAFDSLGEAYMELGDKELAVKFYKKSLELNPDNTNAVEMLKKLQN
jgi:Beta-lactamase class C and other penicillin binding proteins